VSTENHQQAERSLVVFLIADLRGYTRFTHEYGDEAGARLASRFAALGRAAVEERAGRVMGVRGDEVIAVFSSARQALGAAIALQARCAAEASADLPLRAGVGLDAGEPVQLEEDFLGEAINVAARLCALAEAGEVLATQTVTSLARRIEGLVYEERPPVALKGLGGAVRLCAVHRAEDAPPLSAADVGVGPEVPPSKDPTAPFVFVSYTRADSAFVVRLMADLAARGISGWVDRQGLPPGTADWEESLRAALRTCRALVLVASPAARQSRFVTAELGVAAMYGRPIIPVWSAGEQWLECVPLDLAGLQYVDARGARYAEALDEVAAAVRRLAENGSDADQGLPGPQEAGTAPRNPYKGLRAFGEEDAGDFFGRAALVTSMLEALQGMLAPGPASGARLLAVVGPSGSGKSSVVRAGLLPRLKAGALPGSAGWIYLDSLVPGEQPVEALTVALAGALDRSLPTLRADLAADSARGLHLLARRLAPRPETRVVLVIDQFEELFTLTASTEQRAQFIDVLLAAVTAPDGPLLAVLTLRADFYDRPLAYPALGAVLETHGKAILPMSVAELREAIEKPAALPDVRLTFERGLVGDLLFEVRGQVGALPLLEFTLDQLVARRQGRTLTVASYQEIGGVRGALTRHAEATYAGLPSQEHRGLARALFLRLIDPGVTAQDTTRRRAALSELLLPDARQTALLRETADAFVAARLLTTAEAAGQSTLEVSHEALIREWGRLSAWLHEAREDIRRQQAISTDAAEWARRGRPTDNLYRGTRLAEAQAWAARNTASAEETAFLQAADAAQRQHDEEQRAAQERALALAHQAAQANHRAAARLRALAGVLALFLLVAALLTAVALRAASQARLAEGRALQNAHAAAAARTTAVAERNFAQARAQEAAAAQAQALAARNVALSRQLAAQATNQLGNQPDLALLLSLEAHRVADTQEATYSLLSAVQEAPRLITVLRGPADSLARVAFSPDGATVAAGGDGAGVWLWDVADRRLRARLPTAAAVDSVAFSPTGGRLASFSLQEARVWSFMDTPPRSTILAGYTGFGAVRAAFAPDGRTVAAGSGGDLQLWDAASGQAIGAPFQLGGTLQALFVRRDGTVLAASATGTGALQLADVTHRRRLGQPFAAAVQPASVAFSPDGRILATGGENQTIWLWSVPGGQARGAPLRGVPGGGRVTSLAFSPDGTLLAGSGPDGVITLWDVASGQRLDPALTAGAAVGDVAFSPDGTVLASCGADGSVRLWDLTNTRLLSRPLEGHTDAVMGVAYSADGTLLASGSADGTVQLWIAATGQPRGPALQAGAGVEAVAFSPRSRMLAAGLEDHTVQLWDAAGGRLLGPPLAGHADAVYSVAFSPDGQTLASGGKDGALWLWDVRQGRPRGRRLATGLESVQSVAFSPDGTLLAAGGGDGIVRLWDAASGRLLAQLVGDRTAQLWVVWSVAFSPDGKLLATASGTSQGSLSLRLWTLARKTSVLLTGTTGALASVAFSPDGKVLAAGGGDGIVRLWDVASGQPLGALLDGHTDAVTNLAFSPDGRTLASGSSDTTVRLWHLDVASWQHLACRLANRDLSPQEWAHYLGGTPYHRTCPG
jgi:WD40 repeat protein/class 3 adenylate cyclase